MRKLSVGLASVVTAITFSSNALAWERVTTVHNLWNAENCSVVSVIGGSNGPNEWFTVYGVDCPGHNRIHVLARETHTWCDVESETSGYDVLGNCERYRIYDID